MTVCGSVTGAKLLSSKKLLSEPDVYCPPNSQFVFIGKARLVGCSLVRVMPPTSAISGSAATPAPPIRLACSTVRREIRRLAAASCSSGPSSALTAGRAADLWRRQPACGRAKPRLRAWPRLACSAAVACPVRFRPRLCARPWLRRVRFGFAGLGCRWFWSASRLYCGPAVAAPRSRLVAPRLGFAWCRLRLVRLHLVRLRLVRLHLVRLHLARLCLARRDLPS